MDISKDKDGCEMYILTYKLWQRNCWSLQIFDCLGRVCVCKETDVGVIWTLALESIIHELRKNFFEALIQRGNVDLP